MLLDIAHEMAVRCDSEDVTRFEAWSRLGDEARKLNLTAEEFLWKIVWNNMDDTKLEAEIQQDRIRFDRWLVLKAIPYANQYYIHNGLLELFNLTGRIKYRMGDRSLFSGFSCPTSIV